MCGIFTAINNDKKELDIIKLLNSINHRGPDDFGWASWQDSSAEFSKEEKLPSGEVIQGHARLSILDLSPLGWQPMRSACGNYSLCYNGEVYNYIELREELEQEGVSFVSNSDSEVILYALIKWGENAISRFRGMFAFTFYDSVNKELLVVRDFFGIKPLYYAQVNNNIYFASEVEQLNLLEDVENTIDSQMVYEYMLSGATDHSTDTMYSSIKQFPSAHYAKIKVGEVVKIEPIRYWDIDLSNKITPTFENAVSKVRELFLDSVRLHMRSDVPIGAALSGGIDSSAIVCAIRHLYPEQEIHSFSFIADNDNLSEEKWIDIVNSHVNAKAHKIRVKREELVQDLDDLVRTQGEPFGSTSIYAQYRVFKEAKDKGITVMLDGQGADEMLAGYIFFQASLLAGLIRQGKLLKARRFYRSCIENTSSTSNYLIQTTVRELLPVSLAQKLKKVFIPSKRLPWLSESWMLENGVSDANKFKRKVDKKHPVNAHLKSNLTELGLPHLLRYEDRDSMRWSIESRVPFLHVELVEYLYSLPEEYLLNEEGTSKYVFREAMRGIVPDEILDRKDKIGFATPERDWLTKMESWVNDKLDKAESLPMFNSSELKQEWEKVLSGEIKFDFRCWRWLNLITWLDRNETK
ncbi:asparagine synthase (glutamine-hydrolyzing) [Pseudoalteromonas sp. JC3]|uniref:asparagine synthase (glutamine-hydrolyzing) n=1 Tax=Pseudoalteromonas sp. JC3 TaxID=2810196 RepID=UPI0019D16FFF|nr:asparagine synthase (glutamine-hydrolyzing) [Pseudoalteromonas sp. JC3]MBR8842457.1 asparagine synthase (glutamine-hydrolyzing) [Pseudoalteromonas sp. JC3]WJE09424.1 asparagine synthase (glutamine-hydrolyzing) [Pseudoalteromonas sp. JC3]